MCSTEYENSEQNIEINFKDMRDRHNLIFINLWYGVTGGFPTGRRSVYFVFLSIASFHFIFTQA